MRPVLSLHTRHRRTNTHCFENKCTKWAKEREIAFSGESKNTWKQVIIISALHASEAMEACDSHMDMFKILICKLLATANGMCGWWVRWVKENGKSITVRCYCYCVFGKYGENAMRYPAARSNKHTHTHTITWKAGQRTKKGFEIKRTPWHVGI